MRELTIHNISLVEGNHKGPGDVPTFLSEQESENVYRLHKELPFYEPTPLVSFPAMATDLGLCGVYIKDESKRFGLNAFKGLGGIYALTCVVCRALGLDERKTSFEDFKQEQYRAAIQEMVFITTTDGNHGRGVAWAAGLLGCEAHIYMPVGFSEESAQAIRDVNHRAEVTIMETGYDDTVRYTAKLAEEKGWYLVQDTSWDGYEEVPKLIVQGYTTMVREALQQLEDAGVTPTHVFLQAGVGAMAGSVAGYLANYYKEDFPYIAIVEPNGMACIYQSAKEDDGEPHVAINQGPTIMAGLNCGEPCTIIWPILRDFATWYLKCPDSVTEHGMQVLANPVGNDPAVSSGQSGAVTAGLVHTVCGNPEYEALKHALKLDENAVVLCFNTEGKQIKMKLKEG